MEVKTFNIIQKNIVFIFKDDGAPTRLKIHKMHAEIKIVWQQYRIKHMAVAFTRGIMANSLAKLGSSFAQEM